MKFDLRRNNIVNEQDAIEFLDFIVERAPQLKEVFKKQKFQVAALKNRLAFKDKEIERTAIQVVPTETAVTTEDAAPEVQDEASKRLAQIKQAVKPGEIGHLEVKREADKVEDIPKVKPEDTESAASKVAKAQKKSK